MDFVDTKLFSKFLCVLCVLCGNITPMDFVDAKIKLQMINQDHLLAYWPELNDQQKKCLLGDIENLDIETFNNQKKLLLSPIDQKLIPFSPFKSYDRAGNQKDQEVGQKLIADGRVGCILIAGGQGTRLKFNGPKGKFPISVIKQKTVFQIFAEKVLAASKRARRPLSLAIMTSPLNHEETVQFFVENSYFGLQSEQISFFTQSMLPFLDMGGNMFLDDKFIIAEGPDGNGSSLKTFIEQGIWQKWRNKGIAFVNYIIVDNPLADPFDAELIGYHQRKQVEVTVKCIEKTNPNEKVGVLVVRDGKVSVIEYSEMPKEALVARNADDRLTYNCANLSLFCFSMDFIKSMEGISLPLHVAQKTKSTKESNINVWKYENFIFDVLAYTQSVSALLYPREICFAPLKNFEGNDSIETVRKTLQQRDRDIFTTITGKEPPDTPFELSQEFYYPTPEFIARWRVAPYPDKDYIE